jgi:DNA-binding NtrC family response regulator
LKDRREDIPEIAVLLLDDVNKRYDKEPQWLTPGAIEKLRRHHWSGNIRELKNVIRRAAINCLNTEIGPEDIYLQVGDHDDDLWCFLPEPAEGFVMEAYINEVRNRLYDRAMEIAGGNQSQAGRLLGRSGKTVSQHYRRKKTS